MAWHNFTRLERQISDEKYMIRHTGPLPGMSPGAWTSRGLNRICCVLEALNDKVKGPLANFPKSFDTA